MNWIKTYPAWQQITEQREFKIYRLDDKPNWIYRRAGIGSDGNPIWQYQAKAGERYWHSVENEESLEALNARYQKNLEEESNIVNRGSQDYWTLITIMAGETYESRYYEKNKQSMADVAQAIYNRYNIPDQPYGKTIKEIILAAGQFQPVTDGIAKGADWKNIKNREDAIKVYMTTKGRERDIAEKQIDDAIEAQASSLLRSEASKHVGSRTEFLATSPTSKYAVGKVEREPKNRNNCFYWRYAGKTHFYNKDITTATAVPDSVEVSQN